eukprot:TRINITY_DN2799_c0_g1_i1.p1 TRINITY_DN2799_c0_g1~~TRINITY_DN2799_c0_g1_i1.p1  ORF type:complete len:453 (+),score=105.40 TRINITY_DN2799_c0_g1_i1:59-1417(+)
MAVRRPAQLGLWPSAMAGLLQYVVLAAGLLGCRLQSWAAPVSSSSVAGGPAGMCSETDQICGPHAPPRVVVKGFSMLQRHTRQSIAEDVSHTSGGGEAAHIAARAEAAQPQHAKAQAAANRSAVTVLDVSRSNASAAAAAAPGNATAGTAAANRSAVTVLDVSRSNASAAAVAAPGTATAGRAAANRSAVTVLDVNRSNASAAAVAAPGTATAGTAELTVYERRSPLALTQGEAASRQSIAEAESLLAAGEVFAQVVPGGLLLELHLPAASLQDLHKVYNWHSVSEFLMTLRDGLCLAAKIPKAAVSIHGIHERFQVESHRVLRESQPNAKFDGSEVVVKMLLTPTIEVDAATAFDEMRAALRNHTSSLMSGKLGNVLNNASMTIGISSSLTMRARRHHDMGGRPASLVPVIIFAMVTTTLLCFCNHLDRQQDMLEVGTRRSLRTGVRSAFA